MTSERNYPGAAPGTVYLVGAGPGAPDLITVRGLDILRRADFVVYDALVNRTLLGEAPTAATRVFAGKRAGDHALRQEEINELLYRAACAHPVVVRLKGGDPFVFGRGGEEMAYLRARGVPVEVVPGVTSAVAAAAVAGVPVTHRQLSNSFAVVAGHLAADAPQEPCWEALACIDTLVVMMGLRNAGRVVARLIQAGRAPQTPALVVSAATLPEQQVVVTTLAGLEEAVTRLSPDAPSTLVVGAVVGLAEAAGGVAPEAWAPLFAEVASETAIIG
jgi:uroporphyrin-III C-methyltransferase